MNEKEAILIGKFTVLNNGVDISSETRLFFDKRLSGKHAVIPDENNFVYMRLPVGHHFIGLLSHKEYHKNFSEYFAKFYLPEGKLYYVGDIKLELSFDNNDKVKAGMTAYAVQLLHYDRDVKISVIDNYDSTCIYFREKFNTSDPIEKFMFHPDS